MASNQDDDIALVDISDVLVSSEVGGYDSDILSGLRSITTTQHLKKKKLIGNPTPKDRVTKSKSILWDEMQTMTTESLLKEVRVLRESNKTLQDNGVLLIEQFNLQHNDIMKTREKVSSLFQENCSLKEQLANHSLENRLLHEKLLTSRDDNAKLRKRLSHISQQLRGFVQKGEAGSGNFTSIMHKNTSSSCSDLYGDHCSKVGGIGDASFNVVLSEERRRELIVKEMAKDLGIKPWQRYKPEETKSNEESGKNWSFIISEGVNNWTTLSKNNADVGHHLSIMETLEGSSYEDVSSLLGVCKRNANRVKLLIQNQNDLLKSFVTDKHISKLGANMGIDKNLSAASLHLNNSTSNIHVTQLSNLNDKEDNFKSTAVMPSSILLGGTTTVMMAATNSQLTKLCLDNGNSSILIGPIVPPSPTLQQQQQTNIYKSLEGNLSIPQEKLQQLSLLSDNGQYPNSTIGKGLQIGETQERICPLCELSFPPSFPQNEFEQHVLGHFDNEEFEILDDLS